MNAPTALNSATSQILVIDDSHDAIESLVIALRVRGQLDFEYHHLHTVEALQDALVRHTWDLILCASTMRSMEPSDAVQLSQRLQPQTPLLVIADPAHPLKTIDLIRLGAASFIEIEDGLRLVDRVKQALESSRRAQQVDKAEAFFQVREARYQNIVDSQPELICRYDADFHLTFVNWAYCQWQGKSSEALLGWNFIENIPQPARDQAIAKIKALTADHPIATSIHQSRLPDGSYYLIEWTDRALFDSQGRILEYQGTGRDVTEREKQAQQLQAMKMELEMQRDDLNGVLDKIQDAVISLSVPDRQLIFASASFEEVCGFPAQTFVDNPKFFEQVVYPDDLAKTADAWETCMRDGFVEFEHRAMMPNGELHWFYRRRWLTFDQQGRPIRVNDSARDITADKEAALTLKKREQNLRALFNTIDDFLFVLDMRGQIRAVNNTVLQRLSYSLEQMIDHSVLMVHAEEMRPEATRIFAEVMEGKRNNCPLPLCTSAGDLIPVETAITRGVWDGQPSLFAVSKDISALKISEEKFARAFHASPAILIISEVETGNFVEVNQTFCNKLGFVAEEVIGKRGADLLRLDEQHRWQMIETVRQQGFIRDEEATIYTKDGRQLTILMSAEVITLQNKRYNFITAVDITERRSMEEALRQSEKRYRQMFELHGLPKLIIEPQTGRIVDANPAAAAFYGHDATTLKTMTVFDINLSPQKTVEAKLVQAATTQIMSCEFLHRAANNTPRNVELFTGPIEIDGKQLLYSIVTDITEKHQAQTALQEALELLEQRVIERTAELERTKDRIEAIFNHSGDGIVLVDVEQSIQQANYAFESMFTVPANTYFEAKLPDFFHPDSAVAVAFHIRDIAATHQTYQLEARAKRMDGTSFDVEISIAPINRSDKAVTSLVCIIRDITERKQAENALRESEERYRTTIAALSEGIVMQDAQGAIRLCNAAAEEILGLTADQMMGLTSIDPRWRSIYEDGAPFPGELHPGMVTLQTGQPQSNIIMGVHKPDGVLTWISINSQPIINPSDSKPSGIVATFEDITKRKNALDALEQKLHDEYLMQMYLRTLHEVSIELARATSLDEFYRMTVEFGLKRFGFERMGLMVYDSHTGMAIGTYGTDAAGNLYDEHHIRLYPHELTGILQRMQDRNERFAFDENAQLFADFKLIGTGQQAVATLWNGKMLGWLSIDNALHHQPISQAHLDLLAFYALTAGSLLARKHAELALRESEQRYRLLAENIKDVIIKMLPDGTQSFVTPSCYYLIGYTPEEMIGRSVFDLVHPDDIPVSESIMKRAVVSGDVFFTLTQRILHKDGHYVWIEMTNTIIRDPETQNPTEFIGLAHDITERQQAETALRVSEERFRQFIESAPIAAIICDPDGRIILVNREAEKLFDYERDGLIGQSIEALVPEILKEAHIQHREDFILSPNHYRIQLMELPARRKSGGVFPADIQLRHIDMTPTPLVMSFIIDITQRKQTEEALKHALAQEKELGELKSRFVSMASHEFRTPLAAILATTETLTFYRDRMDAEQIDARLDKIRQQVSHMKDIMEDVLQLARMQAGRVEFKPLADDLQGLCWEIVEEFESQVEFRGRVFYEACESPVRTLFDRRLMRQVITNVVHNALKYSQAEKPVFMQLRQDEKHITLTVKDEGIGIPPEDVKRMFEPFHRANNVGTISGTGLGLSITKQAVELHNGTITIVSQLGVGTTATVTLPNVLTKFI
jgi:PAS domain S-box-containing protein